MLFGAQSRGPRTPCVRFAFPVTRHDATLGSGQWSAFPARALHPLDRIEDFRCSNPSFLLSKLSLAHDRTHKWHFDKVLGTKRTAISWRMVFEAFMEQPNLG